MMQVVRFAGLPRRVKTNFMIGTHDEEMNQTSNIDEDKALRLIGLAMRARKLACGREAVNISVKKKKARLLIVAKDSADRTIADMTKLAKWHKLPIVTLGSLDLLGRFTGTDIRACIAVEDEGFSSGILGAVMQG